MKSDHLTRDIQQSPASASLVHVVKPDIIVSSGIPELDNLLGGFKAGEVTLVDGNSSRIAELPNQLCISTYRTFQGETIYIDGGMCANPYTIARYARMMELDQREALDSVVISRAFTVYQLSSLVQDLLEPLLQKKNPRTLLIGMLPALYLDSDVPAQEAETLLKQDLEKIQDLTKKYQLITVFTNLDAMPLSPSRGLGKILYESVNEVVRMKEFEHGTSLELVKRQKSTMIVRCAEGQRCLEEFGMVR